MSSAIEKVEFIEVPGKAEPHKLTIYALSTCAYCRKAMRYLEEHGLTYRYIYLDQLDFDLKREVKQELKSRFLNIPVFPVLTIDGEDALSGFVQQKWAERIGISGDTSQ
jgi:glutaredoxin-like protein NrdH